MSFSRLASSSLSGGLREVYNSPPQNYKSAYVMVSTSNKGKQEPSLNHNSNMVSSVAVGALGHPKEESKEEKLNNQAYFLQDFLTGLIENVRPKETKNEEDAKRDEIIISYLSEIYKAIAVAKQTFSASL